MKKLFAMLLFLGLAAPAWAQTIATTQPLSSQRAEISQTIGLAQVSLVYHRPAVKGRQLVGKLIPYGNVWRAGANENTIIRFSDPVRIEGQDLAAGTYGLHMIPGEKEWVVIFSHNSSSWGSFSYTPQEDALRVTVSPGEAGMHHEFLTYAFEAIDADQAVCALYWGKLRVPFSVATDVQEQVLASLRLELRDKAGWTWQGWNEAARYCLTKDINYQEAMGWATRSVFMSPNTGNMITKARLASKIKGDESYETLVATLEQDLAAFPVTWKEWHGAANYLIQKETHPEKSLAWLETSIGMSPNMTNMIAKADLLDQMNKGKQAQKVREAAIARGSNAELNNYGYQLLFAGKTQEAVAVFKANVDKHPEDPNVWDSLGEGYFNAGEKEKAIKSFKKSLSLNPPANVKANSLKHLSSMGIDYAGSQ